jgi:hypothetical protein
MKYTQCQLTRKGKIQIAWIPEQFATAKNVIKLKINDKWQDGWVVSDIYYGCKTEESLAKHEQMFRDFQITLDE